MIGFTTLISALNNSEQLSAWILPSSTTYVEKKSPGWELLHYDTLSPGKSYGKTLSIKLRDKYTANYQVVTKVTFVARLPFLTFDIFLQEHSNLPWNSGGDCEVQKNSINKILHQQDSSSELGDDVYCTH